MVIEVNYMQITIFSGFSKEANSTKQPTGGTAVSCYLKDNTSVVHPVFVLERTDFSINYIQWGSRYYFVDDIVSIRNTAIEVHCTVDPMATYKTQIGSSTQYVTRSASQHNGRVIDMLYPCLAGVTVDVTDLSAINSDYFGHGGTYVLGVIGKDSMTEAGVTYYAFPASAPAGNTVKDVITFLFGGSWLDAPLTELSLELQKELVNPFQYIVSCMWFPFETAGSATLAPVKFGYWTTTVSGYVIQEASRVKSITAPFTLPTHPQTATLGTYVNSAPFTEHMLTVFSMGDIPIDPAVFVQGHSGYVNLYTDLVTGVAQLTITNDEQYTFARSFGQIGVPVQISQVNQQLIQSAVSAMNTFASGVSTVGSVIAGNMSGTAQGMAGMFSGAVSSVEYAMPQVRSQGAMGTKVAFEYPARIVTTFRESVPTDPEHNGRPLMQRVTISTLSGFIQVENPDVDIVGTVFEKDMIVSYMRNGFYYE